MLQCGGAGTGKGCQYGLSTGYVFTKLYGSAFYETMSKSRLQRLLLLPRIWRTKWSQLFPLNHKLICWKSFDACGDQETNVENATKSIGRWWTTWTFHVIATCLSKYPRRIYKRLQNAQKVKSC